MGVPDRLRRTVVALGSLVLAAALGLAVYVIASDRIGLPGGELAAGDALAAVEPNGSGSVPAFADRLPADPVPVQQAQQADSGGTRLRGSQPAIRHGESTWSGSAPSAEPAPASTSHAQPAKSESAAGPSPAATGLQPDATATSETTAADLEPPALTDRTTDAETAGSEPAAIGEQEDAGSGWAPPAGGEREDAASTVGSSDPASSPSTETEPVEHEG